MEGALLPIKISEEELKVRSQRAEILKNSACIPGCATYPYCERLSSEEAFEEVKDMIERAKMAVSGSKDKISRVYRVAILVECEEFTRINVAH